MEAFPISTPLSPISSWIRRRFAGSRIGAIIAPLFRSRSTELTAIVFLSLLMLAFWGTNAEGQTPLLGNWVRRYVEEKGLAGVQLAGASSVFLGTGGDTSSTEPMATFLATTVNESALVGLTPPDVNYIDQMTGQRSQVIQYTVQEGDLISFIASDFGVSVNSILWANNLRNANNISPGQVLRIPPITGVIHIVKNGDTAAALAKKYGGNEERIIAYNRLPKDGILLGGEEVIIPDGHPIAGTIAKKSAPVSLDTQIRRVGTYTQQGSLLAALKFNYLPDLGDFFKIPAGGFNWGILHGRNGIDIANACGTSIYAAAEGSVAVADAIGWNGGFGKYIKIVHANGAETLYAHASKILVSVGQAVTKGQQIALMGTTGQSTGCHVHFEVHGARNPLAKY